MSRGDRPFHGLRPPASPSALRLRVLDAAQRAQAEPYDWIERLWFDARLWLAAALAFVLLIVAHLTVDSAGPAALAPGEDTRVDGELYEGLLLQSSRRTLDEQRQELAEAFPEEFGGGGAAKGEEG